MRETYREIERERGSERTENADERKVKESRERIDNLFAPDILMNFKGDTRDIPNEREK